MVATAPPPPYKRARELDEPEQARDAKQRRVEPDAQAPSRVAAQPVAGNLTTTTGATALTQQNLTTATASRVACSTPTLCPPPTGPALGIDVDMLVSPSDATSGRPIAGRPGPKRVVLIVRPPTTTPTASLEEPMAAKRAGKRAANSKRPLAAITNVGDSDAQTAALPFVADDRSAWGNAFVLQAPPASARRPAARTADDDDPCDCNICLREMVARALAAEAMAAEAMAAEAMAAEAMAALAAAPPSPPPPPMFQCGGQASGPSTR